MIKQATMYIDISDMYRTKGKTGIQRVVREITTRLWKDETHPYELALINFDASSHLYHVFSSEDVIPFLSAESDTMKVDRMIGITDIGSGDIFFDMDSCWNVSLKRSYYYEVLKANGAYIMTYIYDLIPLKFPHYAHENTLRNYATFISAVYAYSDLVFCDSRSAEKDFIDYKDSFGVSRPIPTLVTKLGADFTVVTKPTKSEIEGFDTFIRNRYLLFVGTIEPRKKHRIAIRALEIIAKSHPEVHLVFAGRMGWKSEETKKYIESHPLFGKQLHWVDTPSDAALNYLYDHAFMGLYLSEYEGFGLPIAEPLSKHKVTIASRTSSMYEVGKDFADYTYYNTATEVAETALEYIDNKDLYRKRVEYIKSGFRAYTWDSVYTTISNALANLETSESIKKRAIPRKLQFVFISNAPEKLARTIALIEQRIKFVKEYVVISPESSANDLHRIKSNKPIRHFSDEDVIGSDMAAFKRADHVGKNWMLRSRIPEIASIDEEFIMLDDDNQPLIDIPLETFINRDGTYNAYYFYELPKWPHYSTSFDQGLQRMKALLDKHNFESLAYSSHQPQILRKDLFKAAIELLDPSKQTAPGDEWSAYFNYAVTRYPSLFRKKKFTTLNWPARPTDWQRQYEPSEYLFENYYDHLYDEKNEIFYRRNPDTIEKLALKAAQAAPYISAINMQSAGEKPISLTDAAHGLIRFNLQNDSSIYLAGLPYFIFSSEHATLRLDLGFQQINLHDDDEIYLCCEVRGISVSRRLLQREAETISDYALGLVSLPVITKRSGIFTADIFLNVNGKRIYGESTRGIIRVIVAKQDGDTTSALAKFFG